METGRSLAVNLTELSGGNGPFFGCESDGAQGWKRAVLWL